ncbi:MAG: type II secretion system F family protein [Gammaproteobacteria bacterium]|nr:type II secretion system F family protein [Gammaproteobacteria bacterium]
MVSFLWYGEDIALKPCQGVAKVRQIVHLRSQLAQQGVHLKSQFRLRFWHTRPSPIASVALAELCLQWQRLLMAGLPLLESVQLARPSNPTPTLRWQLWVIQSGMQQGYSLSQVCAQYKLLNGYQVGLLEAGENHSNIGQAMGLLASQQTQRTDLIKQLKRSLLMPTITLIAGAVVCLMIVLLLVPNIASLVQHSQQPIPVATQWLLWASAWLQTYGQGLLGFIVLTLITTILLLKSPLGRRCRDLIGPWVPLWRVFFQLQSQILVMQLLASSVASGVPILAALKQAQRACLSRRLVKQLLALQTNLQSGLGLSQAFAQADFSDVQVAMLQVAEETGDLADIFQRLCDQLQQRLVDKITTFSMLLEPVITISLAILVGSLVVSIYLPLMQLGSLL